VVKHNWVDREKAIHLLAINALHSIPTNVKYEENAEVLKGHIGDHPLAVVYHSQLKTRTKLTGEPLQDFTFTITQQAHCALDGLPVNLTICSTWAQFLRNSKTRLN
jgi:hypothetical protein